MGEVYDRHSARNTGQPSSAPPVATRASSMDCPDAHSRTSLPAPTLALISYDDAGRAVVRFVMVATAKLYFNNYYGFRHDS